MIRPTADLIAEAYQLAVEHLREAADHLRELHVFAPGQGTVAYRAVVDAEASTLAGLERLEAVGESFPDPRPEAHAETSSPALRHLVAWRSGRAQGRPAYLVCRNSVLLGALEQRPADLSELAEVPGVGPGFLARHGDSFLAALADALAPRA